MALLGMLQPSAAVSWVWVRQLNFVACCLTQAYSAGRSKCLTMAAWDLKHTLVLACSAVLQVLPLTKLQNLSSPFSYGPGLRS